MAGCIDCNRHKVGQRTKRQPTPLRKLLNPIGAALRRSANRLRSK